jgi:thiamine pyrophosphate-dependent acetolactate synthase large subunit-like protein
LVRHFTKWDAQPASVAASYEALLRARQIAETAPMGPVYVCFDAALQEQKLDALPPLPDPARYRAPPATFPDPALIAQARDLLKNARNPFILMGRVSRDLAAWNRRIQLAEALGAKVMTDLKVGAAFPTDHPLHVAPPSVFLAADVARQLREADVILSLDWLDLGGTLKAAWGTEDVSAKVVQVSLDQYIHNGWSMDHQGLPPADIYLACGMEHVVEGLLRGMEPRTRLVWKRLDEPAPVPAADGSISIAMLARTLQRVVGTDPVTLMRLPLGWSGDMWHFRHPMDYLGTDGGGGIGGGPGMTVGAALALKGGDRLPVSILGDGDFMMGASAFWTAANVGIPFLVVVANNRSFFNDEIHQERVAKERGRPVENRWIGQRIGEPDPDLAMMARAQGLHGIGPVKSPAQLHDVLREAIAAVRAGKPVVVDVHVTAGYSPSMAAGMTRTHDQ